MPNFLVIYIVKNMSYYMTSIILVLLMEVSFKNKTSIELSNIIKNIEFNIINV